MRAQSTANLVHVRVHVCALLTLGVVLGLVPAAAWAQAPYEPNDSTGTAFGPLVPGTYAAAIETVNDRDLYRFYVAEREQQVIVDARNTAPPEQFASSLSVGIYDARLELRAYECVLSPGESARLGATLDPGVFYVGVEKGCLPNDPGATYSFTVTGGLADAAIMEARCRAASARARARQRAVERARHRLGRARRHEGARAVERARTRLERAKRDRDRARGASRRLCVVR